MGEEEGTTVFLGGRSEDVLGIKKLHPLGGSYAIIIPKGWIDIFCKPINGEYWIKFNMNIDTITIRPYEEDDL